jgi:hypothetical protein
MSLTRRIGNTTLGLMVAIVGIALLLAILRHGIQHWGRGELLTLNIGMLVLASIPMAIFGPRLRRAFWDGFAGFGWVYLVMTIGPCPWNDLPEAPPLPTTQFFDTSILGSIPTSDCSSIAKNSGAWSPGSLSIVYGITNRATRSRASCSVSSAEACSGSLSLAANRGRGLSLAIDKLVAWIAHPSREFITVGRPG